MAAAGARLIPPIDFRGISIHNAPVTVSPSTMLRALHAAKWRACGCGWWMEILS